MDFGAADNSRAPFIGFIAGTLYVFLHFRTRMMLIFHGCQTAGCNDHEIMAIFYAILSGSKDKKNHCE